MLPEMSASTSAPIPPSPNPVTPSSGSQRRVCAVRTCGPIEGSKPSTRTEADWTVVGANDAAKGTVTIELEKPTETQYLLVYFTRLPPTENGYKARLHEVTVR